VLGEQRHEQLAAAKPQAEIDRVGLGLDLGLPRHVGAHRAGLALHPQLRRRVTGHQHLGRDGHAAILQPQLAERLLAREQPQRIGGARGQAELDPGERVGGLDVGFEATPGRDGHGGTSRSGGEERVSRA
jgi:hypothetical protein